jgi:hypothetical protein
MQTGEQTSISDPAAEGLQTAENRWCEKHGYLIDVDACRARALQKRYCGLGLSRWRQLPLPVPEPF